MKEGPQEGYSQVFSELSKATERRGVYFPSGEQLNSCLLIHQGKLFLI